MVSGRMKTQQWEKDGQKHYATEIVVVDMQMLDSRQQGSQSSQGSNPFASNQGQSQAAKPEQAAHRPATQAAPASFDNFDSDIPF